MKHLEYALGKDNQFWKYIIVLLVSLIASNFIGIMPYMITAVIIGTSNGLQADAVLMNIMDAKHIGMSPNLSLFLLLIAFVVAFFTLILFIKLLHHQSIQEVINGTKKIRWNRIFWGTGVWAALLLISFIVSYILSPDNFVLQFDLSTFIPLFFISILMIPLQTSYEELTFRGYLAQGIGRVTKSRWMALLIPAILFGLMHVANPEVKEFGFWIMMPQYIMFGLIFGLVSILDDGIELALGMHAANNIFLSLTVTHSSSALQTSAIFNQKEVDPTYGLIELIVFSLIVIAFFYKKYNWNFSVLNKKIETDKEDTETVAID
ncbi:CPBP family intramembrane metalloprotease [Dysgonomonas sp. 521]|uniref:CPBP family intramembrane glutamic endopeptidase n=1 Tax=Dysgonomonas sp. 521 TaxID=2302932 RepID=UPI0013CFA164|nr:CPBP family intramembrane glutamic endopeptidase [Dysgonomonas sp. 521]NDV93995.1 CPBP family intramembrane metalloprotease [Dysgonomonas sp. 521]